MKNTGWLFFSDLKCCAAVEIKKPWNYLACTLYTDRKKSIRFPFPDQNGTLAFQNSDYRTYFGRYEGDRLFFSISKVLVQLPGISSEEVKNKISIIIWKIFGIKWLKYFKCMQEPTKFTPDQGDFVLSVYCTENGCLSSLCPSEHKLVLCDDYTVRAGFTPKVEGA